MKRARLVEKRRLLMRLRSLFIRRQECDLVLLRAPLGIQLNRAASARQVLHLRFVGVGRPRSVRLRIPAVEIVSGQEESVLPQRLVLVISDNLAGHSPDNRRGSVRGRIRDELHLVLVGLDVVNRPVFDIFRDILQFGRPPGERVQVFVIRPSNRGWTLNVFRLGTVFVSGRRTKRGAIVVDEFDFV